MQDDVRPYLLTRETSFMDMENVSEDTEYFVVPSNSPPPGSVDTCISYAISDTYLDTMH